MTMFDVSFEHHNFVTNSDIIKHILPSNSAKECLINYLIFQNLKCTCSLRACSQFIPHGCQSVQTLHYITLSLLLHYITMVYILQLALYTYTGDDNVRDMISTIHYDLSQ